MKKVLIPTSLNAVAANLLKDNGNYEVIQNPDISLEEFAVEHADAYAMIVRSEKVSEGIIDLFPNLKVIIRAGAGFNTIDTKYARAKHIDVMNTPGANSNAVAEEVIALILAYARNIIPADISTRAGKWEKKTFMGTELTGKTIGILGLGNIGQLVAKRARGFECTIMGFDPFISSEKAKECGVKLASLEDIFSKSDYITLHIPENDETRKSINNKLFSLMKDGAVIVNCARAGVIDEDDLRAIKKEKNIKLLTDVYPKDEAGDKPIADIADIMLPHLGASTQEANFNAAVRAAEQLIDLDDKGITSFIVNRDIPEGLDEKYCELSYIIAKLASEINGENNTTKSIATSFYGKLEPYQEWLLTQIVAGVESDFDKTMDNTTALSFLEEMGVEYTNRKTDSNKGFDNSITLDLTSRVDNTTLKTVSIRGTVTEGAIMISRIEEFDKLYLEPIGNAVFFIYDDRPGVIATISSKLAEKGINIEDIRNPHCSDSERSLAVLKVADLPDKDTISQIAQNINAISFFAIKF